MEGRETLAILRTEDGVELASPLVGRFRPSLSKGQLVMPGAAIGTIDVLGVITILRAPKEAFGSVLAVAGGGELVNVAVGYGDRLYGIDPEGTPKAVIAGGAAVSAEKSGGALAYRAPSSGRYYGRSSPDAAPFVAVGATLQQGDTVALLEVMKTFTRLTYGGEGMPATARVTRIVPKDGDDVEAGDPIVELAP